MYQLPTVDYTPWKNKTSLPETACHNTGVGNLWPAGHIRPNRSFDLTLSTVAASSVPANITHLLIRGELIKGLTKYSRLILKFQMIATQAASPMPGS